MTRGRAAAMLLPASLMPWLLALGLLSSLDTALTFTPTTRRSTLHTTTPSPPHTTHVVVPPIKAAYHSSPIRLYAVQDDDEVSSESVSNTVAEGDEASAESATTNVTTVEDKAPSGVDATAVQEIEAKYATEVTKLKFNLAQTKEELEQMEGMAKTFEDLSKSLEERLDAEVEEKNAELLRLETELNEKYGYEIDQMKKEAQSNLEEKDNELKTLQGSISTLEGTIKGMESKAVDMEQKISALRQQVKDELENKRVELKDLETQLTEKFGAQAELLKNEIWENDAMVERLQMDADKQKAEFQKQSEIEKQKMEKIIAQLKKELDNVTGELKQAKANEGSWRRAINKTRNDFMSQMRKMRAEAAKELDEVKKKMTQEMKQMEETAKKEAGKLTKERDEVKEELANVTSAKIALGYHLESFRQEMADVLAETKQNATNELEELRETSDAERKKQLAELKAELTEKLRISEENAEREEKRLTKELKVMTRDRNFQERRSQRLIEDLETTKRNMRQEILDTKNKANRDFQRLRLEMTTKMVDQKAKADSEYKALLDERNQSVLKRDLTIKKQGDKITTYEEERSSVRTLTRRSMELIRSRMGKRYEKVEKRLPLLKSARKGVSNVSRRAIMRKDGTPRLAFMKRSGKKEFKRPSSSDSD